MSPGPLRSRGRLCRLIHNQIIQLAGTEWYVQNFQTWLVQSVLHGLGEERADGDGACFAGTLDAEGVERRGRFDVAGLDARDGVGGGQQVVHEGGVKELAIVVEDELLVEGVANALGDATL